MASPGCLAGKTVLVVENEWLIAADIKRVLTSDGARVLGPVRSVYQALLLISKTPGIDAAVLDIHLENGENVYPVAETLKILDIPFVFATGYDERGVRPDFAGRPHLTKPFLPSAIGHLLTKDATNAARTDMPA